jgi:hypothetical protein
MLFIPSNSYGTVLVLNKRTDGRNIDSVIADYVWLTSAKARRNKRLAVAEKERLGYAHRVTKATPTHTYAKRATS